MKSIYSTRFASRTVTAAAGQVVLYVVPAARVAIVKCVTLHTGSGGTARAILYAAGIAAIVENITSDTSLIVNELHLVLNAGETLEFLTPSATFDVTVSGFLLTA